jgi:hypothetical protein
VHSRSLGDSIQKQQLVSGEAQSGKHLGVEFCEFLRRTFRNVLVQQGSPAQNAHS